MQAASSRGQRRGLREYLEQNAPARLAELLPKAVSADRFLRVALLATTKNPELTECQPESVLFGILEAARLGLEIGGARAQAALVVYNSNVKIDGVFRKRKMAQFQPMVTGLMDLARRSKQVKKIWSRCVYEGDRFEVRYGNVEEIIHIPMFVDGAKLTHVYACAIVQLTPDSEPEFLHEVMTLKQIVGIRARSKAQNGPWGTDFEEMARKTVVKRLCKYLPTEDNTQLAEAVDLDNRTEFDDVARGLLNDQTKGTSPEQSAVNATATRTSQLEEQLRVQGPAPNALDSVEPAELVSDVGIHPDSEERFQSALEEAGLEEQAGLPLGETEDDDRAEEKRWVEEEGQ